MIVATNVSGTAGVVDVAAADAGDPERVPEIVTEAFVEQTLLIGRQTRRNLEKTGKLRPIRLSRKVTRYRMDDLRAICGERLRA